MATNKEKQRKNKEKQRFKKKKKIAGKMFPDKIWGSIWGSGVEDQWFSSIDFKIISNTNIRWYFNINLD